MVLLRHRKQVLSVFFEDFNKDDIRDSEEFELFTRPVPSTRRVGSWHDIF